MKRNGISKRLMLLRLGARLRALLTLWDHCEKDGDVRK